MTDHTYRTLPRYANSDLSELATIALNSPRIKVSQKALDFGTAFHTLILEPDKLITGPFNMELSGADFKALNGMVESFNRDEELSLLIRNSERETVRQWICPETGLPLKAKLDACVQPRRRHLIDLKSTSCMSHSDFVQSCQNYNYDRQAAFYLSSEPDVATFFEFVGVQKTYPFQVFRVQFHKSSEFIQTGRKKMNALLRIAKAHSLKEDGWRPSSWSRKEVGQLWK